MRKYRYMLLLLPMLLAACVDNVYDEGDDCPVNQKKYILNSGGAVPVDLGLSVQWAPWNVGASSVEEVGNYYAWGDITPRDRFDGYNRTYYAGPDEMFTGSVCGDERYDVATAKWTDGTWRLPTQDEAQELVSRCIWTETVRGDVAGWEVQGPNGNSIFLPKGGRCIDCRYEQVGEVAHYWQGSVRGNEGMTDGVSVFDANDYFWGLNVRAVWDAEE